MIFSDESFFVITVILAPNDGAETPRGRSRRGSIDASEHL